MIAEMQKMIKPFENNSTQILEFYVGCLINEIREYQQIITEIKKL
jgi:hypothetical protein